MVKRCEQTFQQRENINRKIYKAEKHLWKDAQSYYKSGKCK